MINTKIEGNTAIIKRTKSNYMCRDCNNYRKKTYGGHTCTLYHVSVNPSDMACDNCDIKSVERLKVI